MLDTTFDHLPTRERTAIAAGGQFVDFGEARDEFARLFQLPPLGEPGWLSVRGMRYDGQLSALLVLYEPRKLFGARTAERFSPAIALFELAHLRLLERDAREEAVRTLEDVDAARARRVRAATRRARGAAQRREHDASPARFGARRRARARAGAGDRGRAPRARARRRRRRNGRRPRSSSSRRRTSSCTGGANRCGRRRGRSI